jgi:hypothetical protein
MPDQPHQDDELVSGLPWSHFILAHTNPKDQCLNLPCSQTKDPVRSTLHWMHPITGPANGHCEPPPCWLEPPTGGTVRFSCTSCTVSDLGSLGAPRVQQHDVIAPSGHRGIEISPCCGVGGLFPQEALAPDDDLSPVNRSGPESSKLDLKDELAPLGHGAVLVVPYQ